MIRWTLATLFWLPQVASAQTPPLTQTEESGVIIDVPQDWKLLVKPGAHTVTMSNGITQTLTMYWYDYKAAATPDLMLNILVDVVNKQLPIGKAIELERLPFGDLPDSIERLRGKAMHAEVRVASYAMRLGLVTLIDERQDRMIAAFLIAPPEDYESMEGLDLLTQVVTSLRTTEDELLPLPGWWWNAVPPASIAWSPEEP